MKNTNEIYTQLQKAYRHFNKALFSNRLPQCLLTVQRNKDTIAGYFSPKRFRNKTQPDMALDEIAVNPIYFVNARIENALSTLVHEMVHLEQQHFGKPGRGKYHNREWADWMQRVGLMPSNTGEIGGRQTGDQVTHFIMKGGPFDQACAELVKGKFTIDWYDNWIFNAPSWIKRIALEPINYGKRASIDQIMKTPQAVKGEELKKRISGMIDIDPSSLPAPEPISPGKKKKTTYECPECNNKVWGKPKLQIRCGSCDLDYREVA